MPFTVAIDGPAAGGKGTIARAVARHFDFGHLDSGLLYRVVGVHMLDGADPVEIARGLTAEMLDRDDLRTADASQAASKVAVLPEVRAALLDFQRAFARRAGGAVIDGRDIGTVICPQADVKLFVTARPEIRAKRRFDELVNSGADAEFETVLADVIARDERDMSRASSPLVPAEDAILLDTSDLDIEEAIGRAVASVKDRLNP